jgi:prepilin-type N-terminal cleavage/methylation domain-containing protein
MLKQRRNQKGFTLIEIIAVLVLLGILAAVAVPRFFDLQDEAKKKNAEQAVAAGQSAISMAYAKYLLTGDATGDHASPSAACDSVTFDAPSGVTYEVECTGDDWSVESSAITGTYDDDQSATGTWTMP